MIIASVVSRGLQGGSRRPGGHIGSPRGGGWVTLQKKISSLKNVEWRYWRSHVPRDSDFGPSLLAVKVGFTRNENEGESITDARGVFLSFLSYTPKFCRKVEAILQIVVIESVDTIWLILLDYF